MNQEKLNDALLKAARDGFNSKVIELIEAGAEIEARNLNKCTPLHLAAWCERTETCLTLLDAGADIHAIDEDQRTPLHRASMDGNAETCLALVGRGAEVEARDNYESTSLHRAAYNGHTETCLVLLGSGAEIEAKDKNGSTSLHCAARNGAVETCLRLLEAGAEIDAMNDDKWTPLHFAARSGAVKTSLALIAFGACSEGLDQKTDAVEIEIKAMTGITARQAAVQGGLDGRLLELLTNHPSDREDDQAPALIALAEKYGKEKTTLILRAHAAQIEANKTLKELELFRPCGVF